ncbi:MAG: hypothetical protein ABI127_02955 [Dokdonella sp.]
MFEKWSPLLRIACRPEDNAGFSQHSENDPLDLYRLDADEPLVFAAGEPSNSPGRQMREHDALCHCNPVYVGDGCKGDIPCTEGLPVVALAPSEARGLSDLAVETRHLYAPSSDTRIVRIYRDRLLVIQGDDIQTGISHDTQHKKKVATSAVGLDEKLRACLHTSNDRGALFLVLTFIDKPLRAKLIEFS